jgi:hypothetical protein
MASRGKDIIVHLRRRSRVTDEFQAGEYKFRVAGFDGLTVNQQVILETIVELTLERRIPPSIRDVLRSVIGNERATLKSKNSVQAMQRAINALTEHNFLEQTIDTVKTVCYWPTCLQVVPKPEFVVDE